MSRVFSSYDISHDETSQTIPRLLISQNTGLTKLLVTESEHQKFHFMKANTSRNNNKPIRTSRRAHTSADRFVAGHSVSNHELDIAVLDANGDQWMSAWDERFERLGISHLRSPMFFHPDPRDRDGLLEFTVSEGRQDELKEIQGVVGKELSKHQRKKKLKDG